MLCAVYDNSGKIHKILEGPESFIQLNTPDDMDYASVTVNINDVEYYMDVENKIPVLKQNGDN